MRPRMLKQPSGPPVSEWDVTWLGVRLYLPPGHHVVTEDGDEFFLKTAEELYAEDRKRAGRPLKFTLEQARRIKTAYWNGHTTIAEWAREYNCAETTISRIVHGKTYWYA